MHMQPATMQRTIMLMQKIRWPARNKASGMSALCDLFSWQRIRHQQGHTLPSQCLILTAIYPYPPVLLKTAADHAHRYQLHLLAPPRCRVSHPGNITTPEKLRCLVCIFQLVRFSEWAGTFRFVSLHMHSVTNFGLTLSHPQNKPCHCACMNTIFSAEHANPQSCAWLCHWCL